ncbi:hypothetical protein LguiA_026101 [Lonicera macranthoides]
MLEHDVNEIACPIREALRDNKYLLLLDDGNVDLEFDQIGIDLNNENGSKIVLTTTMESVCNLIVDRVVELKPLTLMEAWKMFKNILRRSNHRDDQAIKQIMVQIVAYCGGLPLIVCWIVGEDMYGNTSDAKHMRVYGPMILEDLKKVLNVVHARIVSLPSSISRLINLKVLYLNGCTDLTVLLSQIGVLEKIEVLDMRGIGVVKYHPEAKIYKIAANLNKLTTLKLCDEGGVEDDVIKLVAGTPVCRTDKAEAMKLSCVLFRESPGPNNFKCSLAVCAPHLLKLQTFTYLIGTNQIKAIANKVDEPLLPNIEELYVKILPGLESNWKGPLALGSLKKLKIEKCSQMKDLFAETGNHGLSLNFLPNLEMLILVDMPNLANICAYESVEWPAIETLRLPFNKDSATRLKLIEAEQSWWEALHWQNPEVKALLQPYYPLG